MLAAGGTNLVQFAPGVFGTTALPLLGVNPPKPKGRPPLRNDVPCENQQTPDLRSKPGAPPEQRQVDTNDPGVQGALGEGPRKYGIDLMRLSLKREGLADKFKVVDKDVTKAAHQEARDEERQVTAIKKNLGNFAAIIGLIVIAAGVSVYILNEQRMRFPFFEPKPFQLKAEFSTAQAVVAGQGQTVRVSGVRIGDIGGVELKDGRAVIKMDIDQEYKDLVHTNATALLRPKTGLKDMFIDLEPGGGEAPVAKQGFTIPIRATQPDVNPDEVLGVLDTDTREYLQLLVNGLGRGLEGRGGDLRDLFARFEPTHRDLARVNGAVADAAQAAAPPDHLAQRAQQGARVARRRPRPARRLLRRRVRLVRQGAGQRLERRARAAEHAAADHRHARARRDVRRAARPDDRRSCARRARALDPANQAVRPFATRGDAAAAQEHPPVRARVAPARARPAPGLRAPRRGRPGPDAGVPALQPLPQPARLQPERHARGPTTPPARRATCSGWPG